MPPNVTSQQRVETKFLISTAQKIYFENRLRQLFVEDAHGVNGKYPVFSRYFETEGLEFFRQKMEGEFFHIKLRARRYSNSLLSGSPLFLESKIKQSANQTKIRIYESGQENYLLDTMRWDESPDPKKDYFLQWRARHNLFPSVHVFYMREAFELIDSWDGKIRINFDTEITPAFPYEMEIKPWMVDERNLLGPGRVLMEIKHEGRDLPPQIVQECRALGIEQISFSKYANCLLALDKAQGLERLIV